MQGLELYCKADMRDDPASKPIRSIDTGGKPRGVSSAAAKPVQGSQVGGKGGSGSSRQKGRHARMPDKETKHCEVLVYIRMLVK
jgi:hypothetical protein